MKGREREKGVQVANGESVWRPTGNVKLMMYKTQISPEDLKEAIVDCWHWMFGKDPIYDQMLKTQLTKETGDGVGLSKNSLLNVINNISGVMMNFKDGTVTASSISKLKALANKCTEVSLNSKTIEIGKESDILEARVHGLSIASALGFNKTNGVKLATAISELARNILKYADRGTIQLLPLTDPGDRRGIRVIASDEGPGIENVDNVLSGSHRSESGLGIGLAGTKRLVDEFEVDTSPENGTRIIIVKYL